MAELESNGQPVGGLPVPHPDEARIREQNARRIARRRQAAAMALEVGRTSAEDLSREGERRQVGGRFERIQAVPEREAPSRTGLDLTDLARFLQVLSFDPQTQQLGKRSFLSSFAPFLLGGLGR